MSLRTSLPGFARSGSDIHARQMGSGEREAWNQAVASLPTGHVLQSFEWGELKERLGWRGVRVALECGGQVRAAALVLRHRLPVPGLGIMYVPKGPCFDPQDTKGLRAVLVALKDLARNQGALFVKVDPDLTAEDTQAIAVLAEEGFRPSAEQVQLRNTMIVDLRPSEGDLRARLNQSTRRNINLAERNGVEVTSGGIDDLPLFFEMYQETGQRDNFILRSRVYYEHLWRTFLERGMARALFARWQGEVLGGCLVLRLGTKAWYLLGASRNQRREVRPNQLIQWEAMRWAKSAGAESYDMWGLPDILEPGQPMWGLYQFKKGFGGEVRRWAGAYDYVARPRLQRLWSRVLPLYVRLRGGMASAGMGDAGAGPGGG